MTLGTVWVAHPDGKPSLSYFTVIERNPSVPCTLCAIKIVTGRNNQIRIHSAFCGHPLLGDPLYKPGGVVPDFDVSSRYSRCRR